MTEFFQISLRFTFNEMTFVAEMSTTTINLRLGAIFDKIGVEFRLKRLSKMASQIKTLRRRYSSRLLITRNVRNQQNARFMRARAVSRP